VKVLWITKVEEMLILKRLKRWPGATLTCLAVFLVGGSLILWVIISYPFVDWEDKDEEEKEVVMKCERNGSRRATKRRVNDG